MNWWVVIQIGAMARDLLSNEEIESELHKRLNQDPLFVYIPVYEDNYGKLDVGYGRYIFINYVPDVDYSVLKCDKNIFQKVLKEDNTGLPYVISDEEIEDIKERINKDVSIKKDDVVLIKKGNLRGNYGIVEFVTETDVSLRVQVGQESLRIVVPRYEYIRKMKGKTLKRKKELNLQFKNDSLKNEKKNHVQPLIFGTSPEYIRVIKKGPKRTKIQVGEKFIMILNEKVDEVIARFKKSFREK